MSTKKSLIISSKEKTERNTASLLEDLEKRSTKHPPKYFKVSSKLKTEQ